MKRGLLKIPLIIFGAGKIAYVLKHYIENDPFCFLDPVAFVVDDEFVPKTRVFADLPVIPWSFVEDGYPQDEYKMMIAIGYHDLNKLRAEKYYGARELGYDIEDYVCSDNRFNKHLSVGENTIILDGNSIQPGCRVDRNVMIFPGNTIAHGTWIEDNCWITSGVSIGGDARIGENTFIGMGTSIGHNVRIGDRNFIGAGAVITKDTNDDEAFIGPNTSKFKLNSHQFVEFSKRHRGGGF